MAAKREGGIFSRGKNRKRVSIIQSCYIPWLGFFDLISRCDEYIIYDQAAYRSHHWHNRNKIKTAQGPLWLNIPVTARLGQPIEDIEVHKGWSRRHWRTIEQAYARARYFARKRPSFQQIYEELSDENRLSAINERFIKALAQTLELRCQITRDRKYAAVGSRTERVVSICLAAGATHYLTGPSARSYLDERLFVEVGIEVEWMHYPVYSPYTQPHGPFVQNLSILDVLFNCGPSSGEYLTAKLAYETA